MDAKYITITMLQRETKKRNHKKKTAEKVATLQCIYLVFIYMFVYDKMCEEVAGQKCKKGNRTNY